MIVDYCEQRSDEWFQKRIGLATASKFSELVTSTGKKSTTFKTRAFKCAGEIKTQEPEKTYKNEHMETGAEREDEAVKAYEFITGDVITPVGLVFPDDKSCSCSPDGICFESGYGLEVKCPMASTQIKWLYEDKLPTQHKPQVFGSLWICDELESWRFISYHPNIEPFEIEVDRDDKEYQRYAEALETYIPEFNDFVKQLIGE